MSIAAVHDGGPPTGVWAVWLAAAVVMAVLFAWRRPKRVAADAPADETNVAGSASIRPPSSDPTLLSYEPRPTEAHSERIVPVLAMTGLASFCVWVAFQLVWVIVRSPAHAAGIAPTTGPAEWPPADRVALSLFANLTAYATGLTLLIYFGGVRATGYGVRRIPNGLLGGSIGIFIALPVIYFSLLTTGYVLDRLGIDHTVKHELLRVLADQPSAFVRTAAVLSAVVVAPLFEELLFRGCIQGGLRRATGSPLVGIVVASTMFASIHLAWTIPPIFVLSLLFGVVYERTRNLWAVTVMHALFNAFSMITTGAN